MVSKIQLYDRRGERRYLTPPERDAFIAAAKKLDPHEHTFCLTLAMTGCRISEGLALAKGRFNFDNKTVVIETLKKRTTGIFRAVPVPQEYLDVMNIAHSIRRSQRTPAKPRGERVWLWSRPTAWRIVKDAMASAGIHGQQATAKGLRHGFAVNAILRGVPLPLVQRWLGHSTIEMTTVYLQVTGEEEYSLAKKMW